MSSFFLFPLTLNHYSPYLIIEASSQGERSFSWLLWVTWAISALFLGRIGCAYFSPLCAAQEIKDTIAPQKLVRIKYIRWIKYVLAAGWIAGIIAAAVSARGYRGIDLLHSTENYVSADSLRGVLMYYFIALIPLLPAFLLGRRSFCHYLCPFGAINIVSANLGLRLGLLHLRLQVQPDKCRQCKRCNAACTMSLDVAAMVPRGNMKDTECILCGNCMANCRQGGIRHTWRSRRHG